MKSKKQTGIVFIPLNQWLTEEQEKELNESIQNGTYKPISIEQDEFDPNARSYHEE